MPSSKNHSNTDEAIESVYEKQQTILFFKSYLSYLKQILSSSSSHSQQNITIFDLKKSSLNVSLELFLQRILSYFKCGIQPYICALSFIDRFLGSQMAKTNHIILSIKNIFKILSVALLIATKNFDDFYYSNAYYARVCGLTLQQLNTLEKEFLKMIDFDVFVNSEEYKIYETCINENKWRILDDIMISERKENLVDGENRNSNENRSKFNLRDTCDESEEQNATNVQVQVTA